MQPLTDRVVERQLALAHQRERHGPAEGLGDTRYAHAIVDPYGQPALYVADPEGVYLAVLAALHDGDDARRPVFHGDKLLERPIERSVSAFGLLLAEGRAPAGQVGDGDHRSGQSRLFEEAPPADDRGASQRSLCSFVCGHSRVSPLLVGLCGVALPHSPYHDATHGSFALAHPFCRYTTAQLQL